MYTIYPLKVGDIVEPEPRIFYLGDAGKTIALGNFFFLLQGEGRNILVDSGVGKAEGDRFNPSARQAPEEEPLAQLARHGVDPASIEIVIATHLHWDHISPTVLQLPRARVYCDPREVEAALQPPHPWFAQYVFVDLVAELQRRGRLAPTHDGDEIAPGITILSTPGHTFGGQSVVVETGRGRAVVTGDVCFTYRNLEEDTPGGFNCNLLDCFRSLERIRRAADIVLPGHDLRMLERYPNGVR